MLDDVIWQCIYRPLLTKPTHCSTAQKKPHTAQKLQLPNLEISNFEWHFRFAFNSLNDYFPTFCTKTLHSLQGKPSDFHCLMAFLNISRPHISFKYHGTRSHIFGPRFEILCICWKYIFHEGGWQTITDFINFSD